MCNKTSPLKVITFMRFYEDGPTGDRLRSGWLLPAGPVGWGGAAVGPGGFTRGCWTLPTQGFTPLAFFFFFWWVCRICGQISFLVQGRGFSRAEGKAFESKRPQPSVALGQPHCL